MPPKKPINFQEQSFQLETNSSQSVRMIENLKIRHDVLSQEIAADNNGLEDFEGRLQALRQRKELLKRRIASNEEWSRHYDVQFGPFVAKYNEFLDKMGDLYGDAKQKHQQGLKLLMEYFGYHPAFRRWHDSFSAVPFKPL